MKLHLSNRIETLFDALCQQLAAQAKDPFAQDTLIVPSAAFQRWLTFQLAERNGIAANLGFQFLAPWLHGLVRQSEDPEPLGTAAWPWRVYELLGHPKLLREHPRLAQSLGDPAAPGAEALRWERAQQVALQLERLGVARPDWLATWRKRGLLLNGPMEAWQAAVWRAVGDDSADLLARRLPELAALPPSPRAVHLFALPHLSPLHWQALQHLGQQQALHLYVLNPCREFWFDLVSPRRLAQLQARGLADSHEIGHPLLAHWAQPTQHLLNTLSHAGLDPSEGDYTEPAAPHLLAEVQRSLLDLAPIRPEPHAADRSLELHIAHSLTRELEVLHDRLLGLFADDPSLQLRDVLVLLPDLDAAAPAIEAVFGSAAPGRRIPFEISGRSEPPLPAEVRLLLDWLDLLDSPAPASRFAALLRQAPLQQRFGLGPDADALQALQATGHHTGLDAAHAAQHGLSSAHTLQAALQRLQLAYCLPQGRSTAPLGPWLALGGDAVLATEALGALQALSQLLSAQSALWSAGLMPAEAVQALQALVALLLPPNTDPDSSHAEAARALHEAIGQVQEAWQRAGLSSRLPLARVRHALQEALHNPVRGGVPSGAVTFSSLASLRGIPARVVAVLGLDDGAWPRPSRPDPTDLLVAHPQPGDRQPRQEQRQQFLDALLSARDVLHLSHTGRSQRDGSSLPPSVLLAELMEFLPKGRHVRVEHPLQAFSTQAFDPAKELLQSFRSELLPPTLVRSEGANALSETGGAEDEAEDDPDDDTDDDTAPRAPEPPFLAAPLQPAPIPAQLSLSQLLSALQHPGKHFIRSRLGLNLPWDDAPWDDAEPFAAQRRALSQWAERAMPHAQNRPLVEELARRDPAWPSGALGESALAAQVDDLQALYLRLQSHRTQPLPAPAFSLALQLEGQACSLNVQLPDLQAPGLHLRWDLHAPRGTDALSAWAVHLALQAQYGAEAGCISLHGDGQRIAFQAVEQPLALLQNLVGALFNTLKEPLWLPPKTAWALARNEKPQGAWHGGHLFPGERSNAHWQLLLRGDRSDPLDDGRIEAATQAVFGPLMQHLEPDAA